MDAADSGDGARAGDAAVLEVEAGGQPNLEEVGVFVENALNAVTDQELLVFLDVAEDSLQNNGEMKRLFHDASDDGTTSDLFSASLTAKFLSLEVGLVGFAAPTHILGDFG